ncbi:epsin-3 [Cordyceps javanica]|uniref:Epsin-3 n=1 Tax=Cordyceps javanica TaxID=43265 RepID=A0A545V3M3_9HYPO|nr:epsin-3 [Cordyceps javanica]TQW07608.1 epsin-3 [Cordyceps javanica]
MDFNDLKSTVSNLTLYDLKAGFRKAQNAVMNYTEMESKVREATNNEPWGASSTTMQEIANGTFSYQTLNEIMPMIYRRFTEKSAEEWRQIYKALQLLEFLIKHGSERVIDDARGHITLLKMLRQFHFIDQNGKDQGINVRNRAKELAELLGDVERIRSERKKARATKNKYTGVEGGSSFGGGFSGASRYGGFGPESSGSGPTSYGGYSGGVYGDGGGFGGQSSDYQEGGSAGRSDRFEEYDEFDEADRPTASSTRRARTERAGTKKTTPEVAKPKEPEVDLFSFDEPSTTSSAPAPTTGSGLADLASPSSAPAATNDDDDDEFDDFQSAAPSAQPSAAPAALSQPLTAPAAPTPAPASQAFAALSPSASTSATPGVNYNAFAAPAQTTKPAAPAGFQQQGPNYFGGVQSLSSSQVSTPTIPSTTSSGPTTMANTRPVQGSSKPATPAAGGDAFGALWGKASAGIKKTNTSTSGPALGQLAKEKSSANIWGSSGSNSQTLGGSGATGTGGGSASGDLLG